MLPIPQNAAHWHLIMVHMPAAGLLFSLVLLWIASAFKDGRFQRVALVFLILTAVATIFTARSGEGAEEIVEHMRGMDKELIHEHEEAAELAVKLLVGIGVLALILLTVTAKQPKLSGKLVLLITVLGIGLSGYLFNVGKLGGQIKHPETRPGFVIPQTEEHI